MGSLSGRIQPALSVVMWSSLLLFAFCTRVCADDGVGSVKYMNAAILPSVSFSISGFPVTLHNADVLLEPTGELSNFVAGNLGIDLLQQAHKMTFDFKKMTLTLQ